MLMMPCHTLPLQAPLRFRGHASHAADRSRRNADTLFLPRLSRLLRDAAACRFSLHDFAMLHAYAYDIEYAEPRH